MTDREEIERLLNQTGRTLEGLPEFYPEDLQLILYREVIEKRELWENRVLHQSDVIELLVGALRDALDKPMQKPLTLEELGTLGRAEIWEERRNPHRLMKAVAAYVYIAAQSSKIDEDMAEVFGYNSEIRAWIMIPTDEEMEAAAWKN